MFYEFSQQQANNKWVTGNAEIQDFTVTTTSPAFKAFVGKPRHELLNWLADRGFSIYVAENRGAKRYRLQFPW